MAEENSNLGETIVPGAEKEVELVEPEAVPRPDRDAHEAKIAEVNKTISELKEKSDRIKARIDGAKRSNDEVKDKITEARTKFQADREAQQKIKTMRQTLLDARDAIRAAQQKAQDAAKSAKRATPYANIEQIEARLAALNLKQSTESMTLSSERELVREIEALKAQRGNLKSAQDALARAEAEAEKAKTSGKDVNEKITKLTEDLKEASAKLNVSYEALKALEEQRGAKGALSELIKERDELKQATDVAYTLLRKQNDEFRAAQAAHAAYVAAHKRWKARVAAKERAERGESAGAGAAPEDAGAEGEAAGAEAGEDGAPHAYANEMSLCDNLARYLSSLLPKEDNSAAKAAEAAAREAAQAAAVAAFTKGLTGKEKGKLRTDKDDEFAALTGGSKAKKAPAKKAVEAKVAEPADPAAASLPPFGLAELTAFRLLDITPPVTVGDLPAKVAEIKAKKVHYTTLPPPAKPAAAAREEGEEGEERAPRGAGGRGRGRGRGGYSGRGRNNGGAAAEATA